jgi:hypothetical protein
MSENNPEAQDMTVTGSMVGSPWLDTTDSGRKVLLLKLYDRTDDIEYDVAVLNQASAEEIPTWRHGDVATIQGDYRPAEVINEETGEVEIRHRFAATELSTDVTELERIEQMSDAQFAVYNEQINFDAQMERAEELEREEAHQDAGAERSLRDFLSENPDKDKVTNVDDREAQRIMADRLAQARQAELQGWGPAGPPF